MVQRLLINGADIQIAHKEGKTIFQEALQRGSVDTVHLLLKKLYEEYEGPQNNGSSKDKVKKCRIIAEFLLKQDTDFNFPGIKYSLLLHFVLKHGDVETFKVVLLESRNFDVDALGPGHKTLLQNSVFEGREVCAKYLLDYGADIKLGEKQDCIYKFLLDYASSRKDVDMMDLLICKGLDINVKDKNM